MCVYMYMYISVCIHMHIVSVYLCIKEVMLGDKVRALPLAISMYMMYIYDIYIYLFLLFICLFTKRYVCMFIEMRYSPLI